VLGRLKVSKVDGKDEGGSTYSAIYSYGGRGFSLLELDNMGLVYDSGSDIEKKMAELHWDIFNMFPRGSKKTQSTWDDRSDNKVS